MAHMTPGETFTFNISEERVSRDFGADIDTVRVQANDPTTQIRLSFTLEEVGNGNPNDSDTTEQLDGGLAVRMQAEGQDGSVTGRTSRFDDEGIIFESVSPGVTFDVRGILTGANRGDFFNVVALGTEFDDVFDEGEDDRSYYISGGMGRDRLVGGSAADVLVGGHDSDTLIGGAGDDGLIGDGGDDFIYGGAGNDGATMNILTDGSDTVNLGSGQDRAFIASGQNVTQVRITFTSSEVGNGDARESGGLTNQDGGFAVRVQAEGAFGETVGSESRFDDEGVTFRSTTGATFDVRDLVSGAERGDRFDVVMLGTRGRDIFDETGETDAYYMNAGMGNDRLTGGSASDFIVGGAGNDAIAGGDGQDGLIGGGGDDLVLGGNGDDTAAFNITTDGSDRVNLGNGYDTLNVASASEGQIRVTFTSSEVGNGEVRDAGTGANQDGELAVRLQSENGAGGTTGAVTRVDDEGIEFIATTPGVTFDVRDLISGTERGENFHAVVLGTGGADRINELQADDAYYINGGMGNDRILAGRGRDFLVGGEGDDTLNGGARDDQMLGGAGNDIFAFSGGPGNDTILDFESGSDKIDLSVYGINSDDVESTQSGENTIVEVDVNGDNSADFQITLEGSAPPMQTDFIFG